MLGCHQRICLSLMSLPLKVSCLLLSINKKAKGGPSMTIVMSGITGDGSPQQWAPLLLINIEQSRFTPIYVRLFYPLIAPYSRLPVSVWSVWSNGYPWNAILVINGNSPESCMKCVWQKEPPVVLYKGDGMRRIYQIALSSSLQKELHSCYFRMQFCMSWVLI